MSKTFHIYRSSAGSGKTRTLAKEYLALALRFRSDYFKHILAVTFTNKATQEMKDRILAYLDAFANGRKNELGDELKKELKLDDSTFRQYAQEVQGEVLHQYAQFSISTIDAFFQKVIRSFTREAGLVGDYRLEVEHDAVVEEVIDNLIDELGSNQELTNWVIEFARDNLENERAWDVRSSLIEFTAEIFREEFSSVEESINRVTGDRKYFVRLRESLSNQRKDFFDRVSKPSVEALNIIKSLGWDISDISYGKNSGLFTFFESLARLKNIKELKPPGTRIRDHFTSAEKWPSKKSSRANEIVQVAETKLIPILNDLLTSYDEHFKASFSAEVVLRNMYVFGLLTDIARKLKEFKSENNLMLLADAPRFLEGVIQDSDTPFIYEKVGSFYRHYLIDEFQDTSGMQWKNFLPLLVNNLDQGYRSVVVGDVKQAVYRWRGGDLKLLQQNVEQNIGQERVEFHQLDKNFRSAFHVVSFNNALFQTAAAHIAAETGQAISVEAYKDIAQTISTSKDGFVHVEFIQENYSHQEDGETEESESWKEMALHKIPVHLEKLQSIGVPLKDIAILVRKNDEGQNIAAYLLQYQNSVNAKPGCKYDVVSNESLRIDGASSVNLVLAALRYLLNPDDAIARAQLGYEFARFHQPNRLLTEVFSVSNRVFFEDNLPTAFTKSKTSLKKLPLFELTETLIEIFELGDYTGELVYLQAFQNLVLDFYTRERNDLGAFLEWWEENKHKKSIQVSGEVDAIQIITIHKSKGLQFPYVIIPFCSWNLDHDNFNAPNLWVKSEHSLFADAGFMPVKYASALQNTFFTDYYNDERSRCYLDNLNVLYVALTRAEYGLIVTAPHISNRKNDKTIARLLHTSILANSELKDHWDEATQQWQVGQWTGVATTKAHVDTESLSLNAYPSSRWRDRLVIRQSGSSYFDDSSADQQRKVSYGIQAHAVLSRIRYADEIPDILSKIVREGLIIHTEMEDLRALLNELMEDKQVASWFAPEWDVRTEVPILLPGGMENRIDRLMMKDRRAVLVDFKTGEKKKRDHEQVLAYMAILRNMNFLNVEGYLLYLRTKEVVEVRAGGKQKIRAMKDERQLGIPGL
ncbi:MAG: UvrD-helicase domain-containing protein [Cyclobacteriaceae bacterium]|nr:UvrD-helicase domain-containing protein [Cyclobacteriaceae bacterium]